MLTMMFMMMTILYSPSRIVCRINLPLSRSYSLSTLLLYLRFGRFSSIRPRLYYLRHYCSLMSRHQTELVGVAHSAEVTGPTLYEAVAEGAAIRGNEWVARIGQRLNAI